MPALYQTPERFSVLQMFSHSCHPELFFLPTHNPAIRSLVRANTLITVAIWLAFIPVKFSVKLREFEGAISLETWKVGLDEWEDTVDI